MTSSNDKDLPSDGSKKPTQDNKEQSIPPQTQNAIVQLITSPNGYSILNNIIETYKATSKWDNIPRYCLAGLAVVGGITLSLVGKFDASIAVLLGSIVGYTLGKDK